MYDYYDYLDFSICREIAYNFFLLGNYGDFKVHIENIEIEREGKTYKIVRPPTFIKDILRFSIAKYNDISYCFYSVKTPLSILGKLKRDIAIDGENLIKDPLVDIEYSKGKQLSYEVTKIKSYNKENLYNLSLLFDIFKNNKKLEQKNMLLEDLYDLYSLYLDIIKYENKAYDLIAKLESIAFSSNKEEGNLALSNYSVLLKKFSGPLNSTIASFNNLRKIFLEGRNSRKIYLENWLKLQPFKSFLKKTYIKKQTINEIKTNKEDYELFCDSLDLIYLSSFGQLDTISSSRRHLLRAIVAVSKDLNRLYPQEYFADSPIFTKFKKAAKDYEKNSTLLLKGFSSKDKLKSYTVLVDFLNSFIKLFNSSLKLLKYIELFKNKNKQFYYNLAEIKKCLIFYMIYCSFRIFEKEKNGLENITILLKKYRNIDISQKTLDYLIKLSTLQDLSNLFFSKAHLNEKIDIIKQKRKKAVLNLNKNLEKLKSTLPIHYYVAKHKYGIYESHTNYKFGPWFDKFKRRNFFNAEILLVSALYLLNRAIGEKESLKEKLNLLKDTNNEKYKKRIEELNELLGYPLNPEYSAAQFRKEIKNKKMIPFGRLSKNILGEYRDKVLFICDKLLSLDISFYSKLEEVSTKYLNTSLIDVLFPKYAVPFYHYERDINDQIQHSKRQQAGFTNLTLSASLKIKQKSNRTFSQSLTLDFSPAYPVIINYTFLGKDPTKLSIPSKPQNSLYGIFMEPNKALEYLFGHIPKEQQKIFYNLDKIPELLNIRKYLLNKVFEATDSRFSSEHLYLFLGLLKDATCDEKGCIFSYNNKFYEFPSSTIEKEKFSSFKLLKNENIVKNKELFEKERILFMVLKQATRVFESKQKVFNLTLKNIENKLPKITK
ncbi:MAG: hypothetical protein QXF48_01130 [Candidatus Anstonellaceae archaeon]